jgi:hypothetical protein
VIPVRKSESECRPARSPRPLPFATSRSDSALLRRRALRRLERWQKHRRLEDGQFVRLRQPKLAVRLGDDWRPRLRVLRADAHAGGGRVVLAEEVDPDKPKAAARRLSGERTRGKPDGSPSGSRLATSRGLGRCRGLLAHRVARFGSFPGWVPRLCTPPADSSLSRPFASTTTPPAWPFGPGTRATASHTGPRSGHQSADCGVGRARPISSQNWSRSSRGSVGPVGAIHWRSPVAKLARLGLASKTCS